jgi:hypothetical protein
VALVAVCADVAGEVFAAVLLWVLDVVFGAVFAL